MNEVTTLLNIIQILGVGIGIFYFMRYNTVNYGCIETVYPEKFLLGIILIIVSLSGLMK